MTEIFRTCQRKVDYIFYYNKSVVNDAKIVFKRIFIFAVLRPEKAVNHPMDIFVILLNVA